VKVRGVFLRPPENFLHTQSSHSSALLKLVTATQARTEINKYLFKVDIIDAFLPHLDARNMIGR
jgi:hypothetical protein